MKVVFSNCCSIHIFQRYFPYLLFPEGIPEGKKPLGRLKRRWEHGIRMDLTEIGCEVWSGFNWLRIETGGGLL
jgi:hypothetical protein